MQILEQKGHCVWEGEKINKNYIVNWIKRALQAYEKMKFILGICCINFNPSHSMV